MTNLTQDLRERCSYLLILFKAKDKALFEKYTAQLAKISAEESEKFYHYLLAEYKKLVEGPSFAQPVAKPVAKPVVKTEAPKKVAKKKPAAKKVAKKVAKKKPAAKKVAKKKTAKKAKKR